MKNKTREEKIDFLLPIICALMYVSSYLGRHSYNSNITQIVESLGVSYTETGLVSTFFFFAYGAGQFLHGILCSKYNEKYVIPAVLCISALVNAAVFLGIDFEIYKYLWLINGAALSVLWPTLIRILSKYISGQAMSRGIVFISASATVGYCLTYLMSSVFAAFDKYRLSFLTASVFLVVCGAIWIASYNGLKLSTTGMRIDYEKAQSVKGVDIPESNVDNKKRILWLIVVLAVYAVATNTIKEGLHVWVPSVLKDSFDLTGSLSTFLSLTLSVFGLFASVLSVKLYSKIKNYLLTIELLSVIAAVLVFSIIGLIQANQLVLTLICFGLVSLLMHTACSIITGIAPMEMKKQIDSGATAGILNGFCYVGSVISSYALGSIADNFGWTMVFYFLLLLAIVPASVLLVRSCVKLVKKEQKN